MTEDNKNTTATAGGGGGDDGEFKPKESGTWNHNELVQAQEEAVAEAHAQAKEVEASMPFSELTTKPSTTSRNNSIAGDEYRMERQSIQPVDGIDYTTAEIRKLPERRKSYMSDKLTKVAKTLHLFRDRKKKRVDENHKHYVTAHCIRDGIRYTCEVRRGESKDLPPNINNESFKESTKVKLPITTMKEVPSSSSSQHVADDSQKSANSFSNSFSNLGFGSDDKSFEFKEYSPDVFQKLRSHVGITEKDYMASLAAEDMYLDFQSNSKSGQFFFFSDDKFFMIKTLTKQECHWLLDALAEYYNHFIKYPKTMLVKFVGMYRVTIPRKGKLRKVHLVVMRSTFDTVLPMHKKFDLKGSTLGREASESDKKKLYPVLKDLDLENSGLMFHLGQEEKDKFLKQLQDDCSLLQSLNMMDYSLLVGIFDKQRVQDTSSFDIDDTTIRAILHGDNCLHYTDRLDDHQVIYFMGIIDFLQHYNTNKRVETLAKGVVNDRKQISSVKPTFYAKRLVQFIGKFVD